MTAFRQEHRIGRGEFAESRSEGPALAVVMTVAGVALFAFHNLFQQPHLTIALTVGLLVFGITLIRADVGIYILVVAMLFSPELHAGVTGRSHWMVKVRYDDILIPTIFVSVLLRSAYERNRAFWRPTPVDKGIFLYYGLCLVSTLLAIRMAIPSWDRNAAFFVLIKMAEFYMVYFVVVSVVRTHKDIRNQLTVFLLVAVAVCFFCIAQIGGPSRMTAPFEVGGAEPNTLGGYLVLVMALCLGLAVAAPDWRRKAPFLIVFGLAFLPFLFTLSRASYLAFLAVPVVMALASRRYVLIVFAVLVIVFYESLMPADVKERVNYTFQAGSGVDVAVAGRPTGLRVDKSTYERIYVWRKVAYNLSHFTWFGGGVAWGAVLDSQYARVIFETGLLGLAAFLYLQFLLLRTARQSWRWSREWLEKGVALGVFTVTVALIVHSLGTITFLIIRMMDPFWFLMALTAAAGQLAIEDHAREVEDRKATGMGDEQPGGAVPADQTAPVPARAGLPG